VGAAEELAGDLDAVANHSAMALFAYGRNGLNGTLEAVESMPRAGRN